MNYEADVVINSDNLDEEWLKQPGLSSYWGIQYAKALAIQRRLETKKKIIEAQLFKEARSKLTEENGKPPSDVRCNMDVHANSIYEEISMAVIDAEERTGKIDAIKWAMIRKETALENISRDAAKIKAMPDSYRASSSEQIERQMRQTLNTKIRR